MDALNLNCMLPNMYFWIKKWHLFLEYQIVEKKAHREFEKKRDAYKEMQFS